MTFPYFRCNLRRVCRFCAEHSALSTRTRSHAPSSPLSLLPWHFLRTCRDPGASDAGTRCRGWFVGDLNPRAVRHGHLACLPEVHTQDPWFDQAFNNGDVNAPPAASHLQRQRPLAAEAHSSPVLPRWTCARSRVVLQRQPPRCPEGGKSPARLAYLRRTAHVQLEAPSLQKDGDPRFNYSGHALAGFGSEAGGSFAGGGPGCHNGSIRVQSWGPWRRSFQLFHFLGQVAHLPYHGVDLLGHLRLLCPRDAGLGLLLLLVVVLHLDYPGGQLSSFGEGRQFLQPDRPINFPRRYPTAKTCHNVALRNTSSASQLCHLLGELLDGLTFALLQSVESVGQHRR
ncbi:hypothetical protein T01_6174 [Trichinella spiralis]|uniref:Uncharacterized protein n=1 Tax=Trichinella spiralis TaxID=6334 RepID=A0A0V1B2L4_TRISP|nr:hypothetical protein T01_6174 [Trichinella spiralis]